MMPPSSVITISGCENVSICGLIEIVEQNYERKSKKTKQLVLNIYQVVLARKVSELGRCRLILRYQPTEEEYINNLIHNHHVYLFSNPEMVITEEGGIIYILNNIRSNHSVIQLSEEQVSLNLDQLFGLGQLLDPSTTQILHRKYKV